jgi:hypothetical protein
MTVIAEEVDIFWMLTWFVVGEFSDLRTVML